MVAGLVLALLGACGSQTTVSGQAHGSDEPVDDAHATGSAAEAGSDGEAMGVSADGGAGTNEPSARPSPAPGFEAPSELCIDLEDAPKDGSWDLWGGLDPADDPPLDVGLVEYLTEQDASKGVFPVYGCASGDGYYYRIDVEAPGPTAGRRLAAATLHYFGPDLSLIDELVVSEEAKVVRLAEGALAVSLLRELP